MKVSLRYIILLLFFCVCAGTTTAQTFQESILYGDEAMAEYDYYGAAMYYRNALYLDSASLRASWKYAEASRLFNNYVEAEKYYYKILSRDEGKKYPLCRFWLALMQKTNGNYPQAARNFSVFIQEHPEQDEYFLKKAKVEIEACQLALSLIEKPLDVSIEHLLDVKVNGPYAEFNAVQLSDTGLLFSALRPVISGDLETFIPNTYVSKLYYAQATQAGWSRVSELESRINAAGDHNANACLNAEQNRMYFTRGKVENNPQLRTEIWYTEYHDGKWNRPEKLNDEINLNGYTNTQPAISEQDGYDVLYFVSDRPGGYGKLDIWYSILKDGKYNAPVNLGSNINTPGDDITPFFHDSTQTLYFSSDWHPGLGMFDIFKSKGSLNQWTQPENIGFPINSPYNDIYFNINRVDDDGYFTSNRPGSLFIKSETCCNDIYYYEWRSTQRVETVELIEPVKDSVFNLEENIKMLLPLTLYFHNDEPNPRSTATGTNKNYKTCLSEYYDMKDVYKQEYSRGLTGFDKIKAEKDIEDFFENYVGKGFAQLKLFSRLLLMDLEKGSRVYIMIKGYCSPLTSTEYNVNLAMRRISSLKNYLFEFEEGVFRPYLDSTAANGGILRILEDPIGESTSSPFVSDNPNDKRNSIYSRNAAFERKIQIVLYESEQYNPQTGQIDFPEISFDRTTHNFGVLGQGTKAVCVFKFTNTGSTDLVISNVEASCGCTNVDWSHEPIPPGGKGEISIFMKTDEDFGERAETVTILSNARNGKTILTILANIVQAIHDDQ